MKKVYISIASFLLCSGMLLAQTPVNRTSNTVVADVLAQIPIQKQAEYNKLIADLSATGEEGVISLVKMIKAPGQGSNSKVDYALSGLSHYVTAKGQESSRKVVAEAYVKALGMVQDAETQAFIIRQLQIVGGEESVEALAGFLNDERLSGPAARALSSIGSDSAKGALEKALMQRMGSAETQENIINALGDVQDGNAEDLLLALTNSTDVDMLKVLYRALSRLGSEKSLQVLGDAAKKAGYTMEPTGANEAYIGLIKRLVANGDLKNARRLASAIVKTRATTKIKTAADLTAVARPFVNPRQEKKELAQVFQALRMEVNHETDALSEFLVQTTQLLREGGRLAVISYHSVEDRMVKNYMRSGRLDGKVETDFFGKAHVPFELVNNKVIVPSDDEIARNPRARSAKLRIARKMKA